MCQDDKVLQIFLRKAFMYFSCFLIIFGAMIGGCSLVNEALKLNDDHILEEVIEKAIENEMGISLDLTPETKE